MKRKFKEIKATSLEVLQTAIDRGVVDRQMIPYLNQLNDLPFICTINCCAGNIKDKQRVYGEKYNPADKVFRLYDGPYVTFVSLLEYGLLSRLLNSHPERGDNFIWEVFENDVTGKTFRIRLSFDGWEMSLQRLINELSKAKNNGGAQNI